MSQREIEHLVDMANDIVGVRSHATIHDQRYPVKMRFEKGELTNLELGSPKYVGK